MALFDFLCEFTRTVTFSGPLFLSPLSVRNSDFSDSSSHRLDAAKVVHRVDLNFAIAPATTVTTQTVLLRVCNASGTIKGMKVRPYTAPTGGTENYTVDLKIAADGGNSFATVLSSVVTVDTSSITGTLQSATLSGTPVTAVGTVIELVITAGGSGGTQGAGLNISVYLEENPS